MLKVMRDYELDEPHIRHLFKKMFNEGKFSTEELILAAAMIEQGHLKTKRRHYLNTTLGVQEMQTCLMEANELEFLRDIKNAKKKTVEFLNDFMTSEADMKTGFETLPVGHKDKNNIIDYFDGGLKKNNKKII